MTPPTPATISWPLASRDIWLPGEHPQPPEQRREVEELLAIEAALLDAGETRRWLELLTDDVLYWVPLAWNATSPAEQLNLVYDDRQLLSDRIYRIETGDAYSQDPPSRVTRLITNIRCRPSEELADHVIAHSVFCLTETRHERVGTYTGRYSHLLRREEHGLRIARKRVDLTVSDHVLPNLTFIL
jgi:benzoate/toluate 1,2-dioxygenase subunit beta